MHGTRITIFAFKRATQMRHWISPITDLCREREIFRIFLIKHSPRLDSRFKARMKFALNPGNGVIAARGFIARDIPYIFVAAYNVEYNNLYLAVSPQIVLFSLFLSLSPRANIHLTLLLRYWTASSVEDRSRCARRQISFECLSTNKI